MHPKSETIRTERPPFRLSTAVRLAIGLALIGLGAFLIARKIYQYPNWPDGTDISVYISAVRNMSNGLNPYGDAVVHPFAYPPLFAELLSLFYPFFSDGKLWAFWASFTFVELIAALIILMRGFDEKMPWSDIAIICGIISVSHLTRNEVFHGQADFSVLLLLVLGLRFTILRKPFVAAIAWGLMLNIKPFLGIVVVYLLLTKRYREVLYTLLMSGVIFVASFAVFGQDAINGFMKWRTSVEWYTSIPEVARFDNQSFYAFFSRICNRTTYGVPVLSCERTVPLFMIPVIAAALMALFLTARSITMLSVGGRIEPKHEMLAAAIVVAAIMSCGPTFYGDYVYLLLPGAFGSYFISLSETDRARWFVGTAIWCAALYALVLPLSVRYTDTYHWSQLKGISHLAGLHNGLAALLCAMLSSVLLLKIAHPREKQSALVSA
jgi:hypothetical protein